ncbi:unknown [Bacteroides sp. CAG:1060]|nr:unknown [Bacteroides sp. CAG:1060]
MADKTANIDYLCVIRESIDCKQTEFQLVIG